MFLTPPPCPSHCPKRGHNLSAFPLFPGDQPGADLGPVISPQSKERILDLIQSGVDQGAKVTTAK